MFMKKIGFSVAGGIILLGVMGFLYYHCRINVLDKITFLSQIPVLEPFQKIEEMNWVDYDDFPEYENFGGLSINYKKEYLKPEVQTKLFFPTNERYIQIKSSVELSENPHRRTLIIIYMTYNPIRRSLILEPIHISDWDLTSDPPTGGHYEDEESIVQYLEEYNITEEDIRDYQSYILYEVVLRTWVETYGGNFEREKEKLESCMRDQTFDFFKNNE